MFGYLDFTTSSNLFSASSRRRPLSLHSPYVFLASSYLVHSLDTQYAAGLVPAHLLAFPGFLLVFSSRQRYTSIYFSFGWITQLAFFNVIEKVLHVLPKNHRRDWLAATRWEKYNFCFVVENRDKRDPRITDGTGLRRHGGRNIITAWWATTDNRDKANFSEIQWNGFLRILFKKHFQMGCPQ
jgi:hypothetical protein